MEGSDVPSKKIQIEKRDSPFASAAGRTRSYQEEAATSPELRSQLESLGYRTRYNVSRGYGSPPPSMAQDRIDASSFATDAQILQTVKNTQSSWNRTKSAPLYSNELMPFCGSRADLDISPQDENAPQVMMTDNNEMDANQGIGLDLKRTRDEVFADWAQDDEETPSMEMDATAKNIAAMPKRSSPSSKHSLNRAVAQTMPALQSYLNSAQDSLPDFSAFANRTDF